MRIDNVSINLAAVAVAALAYLIVTRFWYSDKAFGKTWMKQSGVEEMELALPEMTVGLFAFLIRSFVLALLISYVHARNMFEGIVVGMAICVGFIAPLLVGEMVWKERPIKLFLIRFGHHLLGLAVSGAILAVWR